MRSKAVGVLVVLILVAAFLTACGPAPKMTKVESDAVQAVLTHITNSTGLACRSMEVVGVVRKNARGNKVTIVYITCGSGNETEWAFVAVDVDAQGKLIWADLVTPSQVFTVTP